MDPSQEVDPTATSVFGLTPVEEPSEVPVVLSARDREAVAALPVGSALLIVQRGPNTGARFLLDHEVTNAGRSPKSDIFLDDVTVSRRHVEFHRVDGGYEVVDLGSLNGTYLNGTRIDTARRLNDGDEVQIGKYRMTYYPSRRDLLAGGAR